MPETEVVDSPEVTESISALPDVEPIETPESPASETTEEPRSWSHDDWKEHPEFSEWFEDQRKEWHMTGQEREYGRTQETVKSVKTELVGKATELSTTLNSFNSLAAKAIEVDGAEGLARALAQNPAVLEAYKDAANLSQTLKGKSQEFDSNGQIDDVILYNLGNAILLGAQAIGKQEMAEPFIKRFAREYRFDERKGGEAYEKFIKAIFKEGENAGYQRGLNAGKGVSAEVQKAQERSGQAPPQVPGSPSSNRPTAAQYAQATSEQRSKWAEQGIEPLV